MNGRRVSGRVPGHAPPPNAPVRAWPLRRADLDIIGHVNNAAVWQAVAEIFDAPVAAVDVIHHGPLEQAHDVQLVTSEDSMWLLVGGEVRVAVSVTAVSNADTGR